MANPFGEADCESEVKLLGDSYNRLYFYHTEFNEAAMNPEVFLIVGRRGSGKTALAQYFSFQPILKNARAIDVDEPVVYQEVLAKLSSLAGTTRELAVPRLAKIWSFVLWSVIFRELKNEDPRIKDAVFFDDSPGKPASVIKNVLKSLLNLFQDKSAALADNLEDFLQDATFEDAKKAVLDYARRRPLIVAIDTLENYNVHDESMVRAMAALIECGAHFNREFAPKRVHIKLFMMAEVFPYLAEEVVGNTLKYVRDEVYLHWRPKDLMRLISWRFYRHLQKARVPLPLGEVENWEDHREVQRKFWTPFFGEEIVNGNKLSERTFPYILRHTQLRPRQLILLCNTIAKYAQRDGSFPKFLPDHLIHGTKVAEKRLASELVNAYSTVYPHVGHIIEALSGSPMIFTGNELDKRAPQTASEWPAGEYTPARFVQLVAELGIVGRVRKINESSGYVAADFEYSAEDRLPIRSHDLCAIHPMFYQKLNVAIDRPVRVYPFPDHPEFSELQDTSFGMKA